MHSLFNTIAISFTLYRFPEASVSTPTWLDEVDCVGTENRLIDCPANAFGVEDCDHSQDVGLVCMASE